MGERSFTFLERLYRFFEPRRGLLFGVTLLVVAASLFASTRLRIQEDIVAMLPDDNSTVAGDFRLLQLAPFTKKVVITLTSRGLAPQVPVPLPPGQARGQTGSGQTGGQAPSEPVPSPVDQATLVGAADTLAEALRKENVGTVTTGPSDLSGAFFGWLGSALPSLAGPDDLQRLGAATTPDQVKRRLNESYERLLSPEGWALKESIQNDPLAFSEVAFEKLRFLNLVPNMRLVQNHFISADGASALVMVDSTVPMTDSAGARQLLDRIDRAVKTLPAGIKASVVSGHRYTLVNSETIKGDLYLVLSLSAVAIAAIYLLFLRSMNAVFVFLIPSAILLIASGGMALWDRNVFAVTLGFGGVLLGMVDEYAMMVYFSFRQGGKEPARIIGEVGRPVLFGAIATLISFGVMFLSSLPGQRQLAVYSITGILAALLISLLVLPHLIKPAPQGRLPLGNFPGNLRPPRRAVIGVWLVLLALCAWQATHIRFNGDLRAVNLVTPELRQAEEQLTKTWGEMRDKALIFAEAPDLEQALELNERLFAKLSPRVPAGELVSLAPILPSAAQQKANLERWRAHWGGGRAEQLATELARQGAEFGFAHQAFAPFLATLTDPSAAATLDGLRQAGMAELVDSLVLRSPGAVRVLSLVPDNPKLVAALSEELKGMKGVRLVSQSRFADNVGRSIIHDFKSYMALTSSLVLLMLILAFRNLRTIALVLVPVLTGVLCTLGIMGLLGLEFNIFNIAATILIIGLCVDYGIFMVCRLTEGSDHTANRAVLVSGLTTLAGLGALALARHPSMHSIGVTVLLGIGTGIPAALFVIPALVRKEEA